MTAPASRTRRLSWRTAVTILHDLLASAASWLLAYALRFNFDVSDFYAEAMFVDLVWILPLQTLVAWRVGMYRGLWRYASLPDLQKILVAVLGIRMAHPRRFLAAATGNSAVERRDARAPHS